MMQLEDVSVLETESLEVRILLGTPSSGNPTGRDNRLKSGQVWVRIPPRILRRYIPTGRENGFKNHTVLVRIQLPLRRNGGVV